MDYTTLIAAKTTSGSLKRKVNDDQLDAEDCIEKAQVWLYSKLKVRDMLQVTTGTCTTTVDTVPLGTAFRQPSSFMFTATGTTAMSRPAHKTWDFVEGQWSYDGDGARTTGRPRYWATGTAIEFDTIPDQEYPYRFKFYGSLPLLTTNTSTSNTNFLTSKFQDMFENTMLYYAYFWKKDFKNSEFHKKIAEAEVTRANSEHDLELLGAELDIEVM